MQQDVKAAIAEEAVAITGGARRKGYGPPERNFSRIAALWNAHLANIGIIRDAEQRRLHPEDVPALMILMKVARLSETVDHYDSIVDIVGYALTYGECVLPPRGVVSAAMTPARQVSSPYGAAAFERAFSLGPVKMTIAEIRSEVDRRLGGLVTDEQREAVYRASIADARRQGLLIEEPAPPEIIGTPSADAPPLTREQIAAVKPGDEVWIGPDEDGNQWMRPDGWYEVEATDGSPFPVKAADYWARFTRIRAHRPRKVEAAT